MCHLARDTLKVRSLVTLDVLRRHTPWIDTMPSATLNLKLQAAFAEATRLLDDDSNPFAVDTSSCSPSPNKAQQAKRRLFSDTASNDEVSEYCRLCQVEVRVPSIAVDVHFRCKVNFGIVESSHVRSASRHPRWSHRNSSISFHLNKVRLVKC